MIIIIIFKQVLVSLAHAYSCLNLSRATHYSPLLTTNIDYYFLTARVNVIYIFTLVEHTDSQGHLLELEASARKRWLDVGGLGGGGGTRTLQTRTSLPRAHTRCILA